MEERERQARKGAGGRAEASARLLPFIGVSAAVVAVALVAAAPAGGGVIADERLVPASVTVSDFSFAPRDVTIVQGETVTWTNTQGTHNVVFEGSQPAFPESPPSANVWPYTRSFDTPGTFRYYCQPHGGPGGVGMAGTVTVTGAAPPPGTPPPGGGTPPPGGGTPPPGGGTPPPGGGNPPGGGGGGGGGGGTPSPGGRASTTVTLKVSDTTPARGARVRFFGAVRPEQDGRMLQLQRRARGRSYRTVARIRLTDSGSARSKFSKRFRVVGDAVFRARLPADSAHEAGTSRTRRLDVR